VIACLCAGQLGPSLAPHDFSTLSDEYDCGRHTQNALKIGRNSAADSQEIRKQRAFQSGQFILGETAFCT
jgi:hypothetical protein